MSAKIEKKANKEKKEIISKLINLGFNIKKARCRDLYRIKNDTSILITLKYSQRYAEFDNLTWFGIKQTIYDESNQDQLYFFLLIIENSNNVLVLPFEVIRKIIESVSLPGITYEFHITRDFVCRENGMNLNPYLNNFEQLKM